jgi:hypothetical protein
LLPGAARADDSGGDSNDERYSLHFQSTVGTQAHPKFSAKYSGQNSLSPDAEAATAFVSTLFADGRLWPGGELIFNPELSGGKGLSRTLGVAAFPSGLVYRVGDPAPVIYPARLELRQTIGLGGGEVHIRSQANELAGMRDRDYLRISLGRLAVSDVFDGNRYAHDPLEHFFNWALFASGAWDYPADTRGYTWAAIADLSIDWWSARVGMALEPKYANLTQMEWRLNKARGLMAEYEARYRVGELHGAARLLLFLNEAHMGSYAQVISDPDRYANDITQNARLWSHEVRLCDLGRAGADLDARRLLSRQRQRWPQRDLGLRRNRSLGRAGRGAKRRALGARGRRARCSPGSRRHFQPASPLLGRRRLWLHARRRAAELRFGGGGRSLLSLPAERLHQPVGRVSAGVQPRLQPRPRPGQRFLRSFARRVLSCARLRP